MAERCSELPVSRIGTTNGAEGWVPRTEQHNREFFYSVADQGRDQDMPQEGVPSPTRPALPPEGSESGQRCPEGRSVLVKPQRSNPIFQEREQTLPMPGFVAASMSTAQKCQGAEEMPFGRGG